MSPAVTNLTNPLRKFRQSARREERDRELFQPLEIAVSFGREYSIMRLRDLITTGVSVAGGRPPVRSTFFRWVMKKSTERHVGIFIAVMVAAQGLYVAFPLPDLWPFSNYTMFSKVASSTSTSRYVVYGTTEEGRNVVLDQPRAFSPLDRVRFGKGVERILNRDRFMARQRERVDAVFGRLDFLPNGLSAGMRKTVEGMLPYGPASSDALARDAEGDIRGLLAYLLSCYERNRREGIHDGPPVSSLSLYRVTWDWTGVSPEKVKPRRELVYSDAGGLVGSYGL